MSYSNFDRTIALAGVFQSVSLVYQIANSGMYDVHNFEVIISSLFQQDPQNTIDTYGKLTNLRSGFELVSHQLANSNRELNTDITRYAITLLHLERKLANNSKMLDVISTGVARAKLQSEHFSLTHENIIANLADVYSETISNLSPKIMVNGEENFLSNTSNANKIRALLLGGIRSAVLWRQVGGSRWQLLLKRKRLLAQAKYILQHEIPKTLN